MTHRGHIRYMILAGVAALAGLWILGVPLGQALPFAFFLACPLMMLFMMRGMDHGAHRAGGQGEGAENAPGDPAGRLTAPAVDVPARSVTRDEIAIVDQEYRA